jgi:hypothetical protein
VIGDYYNFNGINSTVECIRNNRTIQNTKYTQQCNHKCLIQTIGISLEKQNRNENAIKQVDCIKTTGTLSCMSDYIRMVDLMVANIRLLAPLTRRQWTQFATIKSPIDAVKFSNTIHAISTVELIPWKL